MAGGVIHRRFLYNKMHEYAITKSIVNIAVKEAEKAEAKKITEIKLVIGDLSTVVDESVSLYFDIIAKDTMAEGAKLNFRRVRTQFKCGTCGELYDKIGSEFDCPKCGGSGIMTGVGREFYIESIEVE